MDFGDLVAVSLRQRQLRKEKTERAEIPEQAKTHFITDRDINVKSIRKRERKKEEEKRKLTDPAIENRAFDIDNTDDAFRCEPHPYPPGLSFRAHRTRDKYRKRISQKRAPLLPQAFQVKNPLQNTFFIREAAESSEEEESTADSDDDGDEPESKLSSMIPDTGSESIVKQPLPLLGDEPQPIKSILSQLPAAVVYLKSQKTYNDDGTVTTQSFSGNGWMKAMIDMQYGQRCWIFGVASLDLGHNKWAAEHKVRILHTEHKYLRGIARVMGIPLDAIIMKTRHTVRCGKRKDGTDVWKSRNFRVLPLFVLPFMFYMDSSASKINPVYLIQLQQYAAQLQRWVDAYDSGAFDLHENHYSGVQRDSVQLQSRLLLQAISDVMRLESYMKGYNRKDVENMQGMIRDNAIYMAMNRQKIDMMERLLVHLTIQTKEEYDEGLDPLLKTLKAELSPMNSAHETQRSRRNKRVRMDNEEG